jgi:error-prone DNA polymerase
MGFYAPAQIVRDAREHGVEVRPVDVNLSEWDCTLEGGGKDGDPALRLGLRQVDGLGEEEANKLVAARATGRGSDSAPPSFPFRDVHELWRRANVRLATIERLAAADAFRSMGLDRRQALWEVRALVPAEPLPLFAWTEAREAGPEPAVELPEMPLSEHVVNDYQTLRLSLKAHPMSFLRPRLEAARTVTCAQLRGLNDGAWTAVAGIVLVRQRPGSANGVVFMTLEDETGVANTVVWANTLERFRKAVMTARLVLVRGHIQRHEDIIHIVSRSLEDKSHWLAELSESAQDLTPAATADPVPGRVTVGQNKEPTHPSAGRRAHLAPAAPRHPRNERILPRSRDFH